MPQVIAERILKWERPPSFHSFGELGISQGHYTYLSTAEPALDSVILALLPKESIITDVVLKTDQGWEAVPSTADLDLYAVNASGVWVKIPNTTIVDGWQASTTAPDKVRMTGETTPGMQSALFNRYAYDVALGMVWTVPGGGWRDEDLKIQGELYFRAANSNE